MEKIQNILLIDDDFPTNYLHEIYLKDSGKVENIHIKNSAVEGLDFIKEAFEKNISPTFIFIDINLPEKNGFEFVDEFNNLSEDLKSKSHIIMCTTSQSPKDVDKANEIESIKSIVVKPLTAEKFEALIERFIKN